MCIKVVINNGQHEIETPKEFYDYFGVLKPRIATERQNECLCPLNLKQLLKEQKKRKNIKSFYYDSSEQYWVVKT